MRGLIFTLLAILCLTHTGFAGITFSVTLDEKLVEGGGPVSGRLVVSLVPVAPGKNLRSPLEAPFWEDQTPMFGVDVRDLKPGSAAEVGASADFSTVKLAEVPKGEYLAAAWIIVNRQTSSWKRDPGNFYSAPTKITLDPAKADPIALAVTRRTESPALPKVEGVEWFSTRSKLLSDFHGRDVLLKAGVVLPAEYDPKSTYGAVYWIPGFGGDQTDALRFGRAWRNAPAGTPEGDLARRAFLIVLDPESPNGHTLFADSDNNGPWARALVTELIPALEAKYPLIPKPHARLLRGHSSGGWSSIWLAINHPDVFGGAWASAPDPVDFRHFQKADIYSLTRSSMYQETPPKQRSNHIPSTMQPPYKPETYLPSYRRGNRELMTVRQENGGERVLGANQTSGQQWASWQAVFGPRIGDQGWGRGHPAALYDSLSGTIDHGIAERYKQYDVSHLLRADSKRIGPLLRDRVRIVVGDQDNFYLNEAVAALKRDVDTLVPGTDPSARITIVPGTDHGTVLGSPEVRGFPAEMLKVLEAGEVENAPKK